MQSGSSLFYLIPPEEFFALKTVWKMSAPPSYEELVAEVTRLTSELGTL